MLVRNQCRCVIKYHLAESPDVEETGEVWLRRECAPRSQFFVDVGANVGDWLAGIVQIKAAGSFSALAFEPSASAAAKLRARFEGRPEIQIRTCALADVAGTQDFFEEAAAGKGSSLVPGFLRAPGAVQRLEVSTLDAELEHAGWERVDLLKIDAEGYDLRVMRGARRHFQAGRIGIVQFEYNRPWQLAGDTLAAAMRFLEGYGYRVFVLRRDGLYVLDYMLYEEYFEYTNLVGVSASQMPALERFVRGRI